MVVSSDRSRGRGNADKIDTATRTPLMHAKNKLLVTRFLLTPTICRSLAPLEENMSTKEYGTVKRTVWPLHLQSAGF